MLISSAMMPITTSSSTSVDISGVTPAAGFPPSGTDHRIYVVSNVATDVDPQFGLSNYVGGIEFQPSGTIAVEEAYSDPFFGDFLSLTDTGAVWTPNVYHTVSIVVDPASTTLKYFYDGKLLASTKAIYETAVNNVVFLNDAFVVPAERETIDNLSVTAVPEPTSLAALAVSGTLVLRRRRAMA